MSDQPDQEENTIVNCVISVRQYINADGAMVYNVRYSGDVPLSTKIGLLELAKLTLVEESL